MDRTPAPAGAPWNPVMALILHSMSTRARPISGRKTGRSGFGPSRPLSQSRRCQVLEVPLKPISLQNKFYILVWVLNQKKCVCSDRYTAILKKCRASGSSECRSQSRQCASSARLRFRDSALPRKPALALELAGPASALPPSLSQLHVPRQLLPVLLSQSTWGEHRLRVRDRAPHQ